MVYAIGSAVNIQSVANGVGNSSEIYIVEYMDAGKTKYAVVSNNDNFTKSWLWGETVKIDGQEYTITGKIEVTEKAEEKLRKGWEHQFSDSGKQAYLRELFALAGGKSLLATSEYDQDSSLLEALEFKDLDPRVARPDVHLVDQNNPLAQYSFVGHEGDVYISYLESASRTSLILADGEGVMGNQYTYNLPTNGLRGVPHQGRLVSQKRIEAGAVQALAQLQAKLRVLGQPGYFHNILEHLINLPAKVITEEVVEQASTAIILADQEVQVFGAAYNVWVTSMRAAREVAKDSLLSLFGEAETTVTMTSARAIRYAKFHVRTSAGTLTVHQGYSNSAAFSVETDTVRGQFTPEAFARQPDGSLGLMAQIISQIGNSSEVEIGVQFLGSSEIHWVKPRFWESGRLQALAESLTAMSQIQ
ncbi:MAG: hypothetical protein ABH823_05295 [bacterium]